MVLSDIIYGAGEPSAWALIPDPTRKELRYCAKKGIEVIEADVDDLLAAAGFASAADPVASGVEARP
jgi:hypothetical protein